MINIEPMLTEHGRRLVCVRPTHADSEMESSSTCKEWSNITNALKNFKSNTTIKLFPGEYHLNTTYRLSVTNFSIIGYEVNQAAVIIKCYCNKSSSLINIAKSTFVEIKYIKFVGCGGPKKLTANHRDILPSTAAAAIFLNNVKSIKLISVSFENSRGHSIFGLNVMGDSVFKNITVVLTKPLLGARIHRGGIILLYTDATNYQSEPDQNVHIQIENFQICNINDDVIVSRIKWNLYKNSVYDSSVTSAVALGIIFNHRNFSVKVVVTRAYINNITSTNGPIVYTLYNSSKASNSITITKSFISNITNDEEHPNIKVIIGQQTCYNAGHACFVISHCVFSFSEAKSSHFVVQYANEVYEHVPFTLKLISTSVTNNKAVNSFLKAKFIEGISCFIYIVRCDFVFNDGFSISIDKCSNTILLKDNKFHNNSVSDMEHTVVVFDKSYPTFEGYNEFIYNTVDIVLFFYEYVFLKEGTTLNISYNTATSIKIDQRTVIKTLTYFKTENTVQLEPCAFQLLSATNKTLIRDDNDQPNLNYTVIFHQNKNYSHIIYGVLLNNCHWLKNSVFKYLNSNFVYKKLLNLNSSSLTTSISRQKSTICFCNGDNQVEYFKHKFNPIFPGQNIPVHIVLLPPYSSTVIKYYSLNFTDKLRYKIPHESCEMQLDQLEWLQMIYKNCTAISYKVYSNTLKECYVSFKTEHPDDSLYIFNVEFKRCPLGFSIDNGSCECDSNLKAAFPNLNCNIQTETITRPQGSWIGSTRNDRQTIVYVKSCTNLFCNWHPTDIKLHLPDTQCINNRAGIACGHCSSGLDAIFGSLKCMKCSNVWLALLPVFMLAGVLLVLALFALDLTVADGKINGFILYINTIAGNLYIYNIFPSSFISVLTSLFNLDLGIETCFYHGMTEYHKTWLQLAFPSYLLFIVVMLALGSRYSSLVEKLTRRRVIPVMATIFLFSYNKLLLVTIKVLFSYTNVYSLPGNKRTVIWTWDSSIPLFGIQFSILFVMCLGMLLFLLLPSIVLLIFTKQFYHFGFVVKYLKPYLDAFQAPFKDNCRYYPGVELIIRTIAFVVGNELFDRFKTQAISNLICVFLLTYLCSLRPFKCLSKTVLYSTFVLNAQCIIILLIYSNTNVNTTLYEVLFTTLIVIAFAEFGGILFHCLYNNYLYKVKWIQRLLMKVGNMMELMSHRFKIMSNRAVSLNECVSSYNEYEEYQEELLALDSAQ